MTRDEDGPPPPEDRHAARPESGSGDLGMPEGGAPPSGSTPVAVRRRLPDGPGGPEHLRATRATQKAGTRAAIQAAIDALAGVDGKEGYPSAERLVVAGKGAFSRARVFEHPDLTERAVKAWHDREARAGRPTRERRKPERAGEQGEGRQPDRARAAEAANEDRLVRALDAAKRNSRKAKRLVGENDDLKRKLERISKGVHDEIWRDRDRDTAVFPGDPLDEDETVDPRSALSDGTKVEKPDADGSEADRPADVNGRTDPEGEA